MEKNVQKVSCYLLKWTGNYLRQAFLVVILNWLSCQKLWEHLFLCGGNRLMSGTKFDGSGSSLLFEHLGVLMIPKLFYVKAVYSL